MSPRPFTTSDKRDMYIKLQTSVNQAFWNRHLADILWLSIVILLLLPDITAPHLNCSKPADYPMFSVVLNSSE